MTKREIVFLALSATAAVAFYETVSTLVERFRVSLKILDGFNWEGNYINRAIAGIEPCFHIEVSGGESNVDAFFLEALQIEIKGQKVFKETCPFQHVGGIDPAWKAQVSARVQQML